MVQVRVRYWFFIYFKVRFRFRFRSSLWFRFPAWFKFRFGYKMFCAIIFCLEKGSFRRGLKKLVNSWIRRYLDKAYILASFYRKLKNFF